uniref:Late embryogenesis abundant protein LEA-2 subgroup domain-containing protein n=1 Tax=Oryza punctata TaxID=4537 RepID=A0A0E0JNP8_ORYPU
MATVGPYGETEKNEPARPLALPSPSVHPAANNDEEAAAAAEAGTANKRPRSAQYLRRRRCVIWCGGCCVTSAVVVGIVILVLALTVFKVKDPELTMNRVTLEGLDSDLGTARHPVSVNATLNADISLRNPNVASFRFDRSETDFYYAGETVGVAYAPDGEVGAERTVRMNVTLDVLADRISPNVNATDLIFGQDYNLTSYTEISGRVNVLGIYKRNLDIKMNCSITLEVSAISTVQSKRTDCVASVS